MKKIKQIIDSRIGFALLSNIIALFVSTTLFRQFWEESDDVGMSLFAEGAYGYNEFHLIYTNSLYGRMLCLFQRLIPYIRWHAVLMLLFSFISLTMFVYVLSKDRKGRVLSVILLAGSSYELYVALQFSKVSAMIAIIGYLVLFELVRTQMPSKTKVILAVLATVCVTFAQILRIESFYLATLLCGCYGICLVVFEMFKGSFASNLRSYFTYFTPVFVIFGICVLIHHYDYSYDGWKEYMEYYDSVTQMVDYHNNALLYGVHGDELKELGVSENDALMYITYGSLEVSHTTNDLMNKIAAIDRKGLEYVNIDFIKAWIANIYDDILNLNSTVITVIILLGIVLYGLYASNERLLYCPVLTVQALLAIGILFYYQYSSRWCHRIVYALLLSHVVLLVYLVHRMEVLETGTSLNYVICLMLVVSIVFLRFGNEFDYQDYNRTKFDHDGLVTYMQQNKNELFVTDVFTMLEYDKYNIFRAAAKDQFENCVPMDSVFIANSPVNRNTLERYGYADPLDALSKRDGKVILVDSISPDVELTYVNEHGDGSKYRLEELEPVGNINLYRIR